MNPTLKWSLIIGGSIGVWFTADRYSIARGGKGLGFPIRSERQKDLLVLGKPSDPRRRALPPPPPPDDGGFIGPPLPPGRTKFANLAVGTKVRLQPSLAAFLISFGLANKEAEVTIIDRMITGGNTWLYLGRPLNIAKDQTVDDIKFEETDIRSVIG